MQKKGQVFVIYNLCFQQGKTVVTHLFKWHGREFINCIISICFLQKAKAVSPR